LQENGGASGIIVSDRQTFVQGEHDFRPVLLRLLRSNPDYVVIESLPPDTDMILKQLQQIRPQQRHMGYYELLEEPALAGTGPFIAQYSAVDQFQSDFTARFGHPFKLRAAHAHALIELLTFAVRHSNATGKPTGDELVQALMQVRD